MRTQMDRSRRGASTVGIVIAVVAVVAVGFLVAYYGSDVFRTKANAELKQWTQWTPENIAKNPVLYLDFVEEQTLKAKEKAKASKVAIAQKQGEIKTMHEQASTTVSVGTKSLDELRDLYKAAESDNKFPITWQGKQYDKDAARRQIMRTASEIKSKKQLIAKLDQAVATLRVQNEKIVEATDKADMQLEEIKTSRVALQAEAITDKITKDLVDMKSAVQATVVSLDTSNSDSVSLDQIAKASQATVSDEDFNKVLNEN